MNNCSSSCHLSHILIWKESTRPLNALNIDHEQTLNHKKIVTSFSSSRFDRTMTNCMQSRNSRNIVEHCKIKWNILHTFSTSQISFWSLYSQHISLWPPGNHHSVTIIINNLTDQVKFNIGTQFTCGKISLLCKLV